jgi:Ca2+-dependent lipid-binding protein
VDESNAKIQLLAKSNSKYADLNMSDVKEEDESVWDSKDRKTGRIKFKIIGATNLAKRKSQKDEIQAKIKVDGCVIYSSRLAKIKWDEYIDLQGEKLKLTE